MFTNHGDPNMFKLYDNFVPTQGGMFLPSTIVGRVLNPRPWHNCSAIETKSITAICENGMLIILKLV